MKLIMTKGLPASGKTTWAKTMSAIRVNKDDLRSMLHNGSWSRSNEKEIIQARDMLVRYFLKDHDVIVDDTNLAPKHEIQLASIAKEMKAVFEVKDFTDVAPEECINRDLKRPVSVGSKVILGMYNQFLKPKPPVVGFVKGLPEAIICDIDGTLALFGEANPYERDFLQDTLNTPVSNVLSAYQAACNDGWGDVKIIVVSGRKDIFKPQTEEWLKKNSVYYDELYMRKTAPDGEPEPKDVIVKKEIYETHIKGKYNVLFVLDDRNQVVDFWRSQGLPCLQVAEGDF